MDQFTLTDAQKNTHTYTVQPHPAREGTRLVVQVMSLAAEPLGRILESQLAELVDDFMGGKITMDDDVAEVAFRKIGDIKWHQITGDLRKALAELDSPQLIRDVLKYTSRDGHSMADDGHFDVAYQQNYLEMLKAVARVVKVNGFLGFTGSLSND